MQNHKDERSAPGKPAGIQAQAVNQSVKGLSIVRLSLTSSGYKQESPEVKRIDELITKYKK